MEELKEKLLKIANRELTRIYIEKTVPNKELLDTVSLIVLLEQVSRFSSKGSTH